MFLPNPELIKASLINVLFFVLFKILLQVATGDLEDLVQRLKKASESSVSSFVKKPEFCMEVVSGWLLWKPVGDRQQSS